MEKLPKIFYWIATGLVCLMMIFSAGMYLFNTAEIQALFTSLGYPAYIVIPLAIAKILAVVAILTKKSAVLKEWAYAGLCFDFILASSAHIMVGDGEQYGAIVALVILAVSYYYDKQLFPANQLVSEPA
ncbi:MAG: DoxX family protein [Bacteroidota bacterium]